MANADPADPIAQLCHWMVDAAKAEPVNPDSAALATAAPDGRPSVRIILVKSVTAAGLTFYTNLGSQKGRELSQNPNASLCFHWKSLGRQVRADGPIERVSDSDADAYFSTRPRAARIGAWASKQSQPLEGRLELERRVAKAAARFAVGHVPRPSFWSGFRLVPQSLEFWSERSSRLHHRSRFVRVDGEWRSEHLYP